METMEPIDLQSSVPKKPNANLPGLEESEDQIMNALEGMDVK